MEPCTEGPAGPAENRGEHEHGSGRDEERVHEFGGPTSARTPEPSRWRGLWLIRTGPGRRTAPPSDRASVLARGTR